MHYTLYFDGACEPVNPRGIAAYGFMLLRGEEAVHKESGLAAEPGTDDATNNVAEYTALVRGLGYCLTLLKKGDFLLVHGDSQLAINQSNGAWQVKSPKIRPFVNEVWRLMRGLRQRGVGVTLEWVPRRENSNADELSKTLLVKEVKENPARVLSIQMPWGKFEKTQLADLPHWYYKWVWSRVPEQMVRR
jgi:ribonuclease HI